MKKLLIGGVISAVIGAIVLVAVLVTKDDDPQAWIVKKYRYVSLDTYGSSKSPQQTADEIAKKFKPIDRINALGLAAPAMPMSSSGGRSFSVPSSAPDGGIFMQYPKLVIGVLPDAVRGGSRITVDDPDGGYRKYHSHVSSRWAVPGSGGWNSNGTASFRGGGPGSGK